MRLTHRYRDDGQRSLRYTPLYANSGFYYLRGDRQIDGLIDRQRDGDGEDDDDDDGEPDFDIDGEHCVPLL